MGQPNETQSLWLFSEISVKLINLEDTTQIQLLDGHKRSIRSATWHPSGTLLVSTAIEQEESAYE